MSLFKNIFGSWDNENTQSNSKVEWKPLVNLEQLDEIVDLSQEKTILIFKHSTRCSISRFALKQFENKFELENKIITYYLDLMNYRTISNEIAIRFGVEHQSPQILLIKNGKSIFAASHGDIDAEFLERFV